MEYYTTKTIKDINHCSHCTFYSDHNIINYFIICNDFITLIRKKSLCVFYILYYHYTSDDIVYY